MRGSILIQCLISMSIGLFILSMGLTAFLTWSNQIKAWRYDELTRQRIVQANTIIEQAIYHSKLNSCGQSGRLLKWVNHTDDARVKLTPMLEVYLHDQLPPAWQLDLETPVIAIRYLDHISKLAKEAKPGTATFEVTEDQYQTGDLLYISDCTKAEVVEVASVHDKHVLLNTPLFLHFQKGVQLGRFNTALYFLGENKTAKLSMYLETLYRHRQPLLDDMPSWSIEVGVNQAPGFSYINPIKLNGKNIRSLKISWQGEKQSTYIGVLPNHAY